MKIQFAIVGEEDEALSIPPPLLLEDARRLVARFVEHYNTVRLHSAIGYVTPAEKLCGLETVIHTERDRKLEAARQRRQEMRQAARGRDGRAASREPSNSPADGNGPLDFAALRRQVSMADVLRYLGYIDPLHGAGPQRRGPCPLHDAPSDRHRSFSVHLGKGVFRCFEPSCRAQGNTLRFGGPPFTAWTSARRLETLPKRSPKA